MLNFYILTKKAQLACKLVITQEAMTTALFLKHLTTTKEKKQIHQHKTAEVTKLERKKLYHKICSIWRNLFA